MAVQQNRKQRVLFQLCEWTVDTVIAFIWDVQVCIVSFFQSQTEKAVGVAGCSLMAFGIIDGGVYNGLLGGFVSYEAADYNVFLFFLEDDVFAWLYIFYWQFLNQNAQTVG